MPQPRVPALKIKNVCSRERGEGKIKTKEEVGAGVGDKRPSLCPRKTAGKRFAGRKKISGRRAAMETPGTSIPTGKELRATRVLCPQSQQPAHLHLPLTQETKADMGKGERAKTTRQSVRQASRRGAQVLTKERQFWKKALSRAWDLESGCLGVNLCPAWSKCLRLLWGALQSI